MKNFVLLTKQDLTNVKFLYVRSSREFNIQSGKIGTDSTAENLHFSIWYNLREKRTRHTNGRAIDESRCLLNRVRREVRLRTRVAESKVSKDFQSRN